MAFTGIKRQQKENERKIAAGKMKLKLKMYPTYRL